MDVTYRLTPEDVSNYRYIVRDRLQRLPGTGLWSNKLFRFGLFVVCAFFASLVLFLAVGDQLTLAGFLSGIVVGAAIVIGVFWLNYFDQEKKLIEPDGPTLADHTIAVNASGLAVTAPHMTAHYVWKAFKDVSRDRGLIVLWLEPALGVVIPDRAFASVGALDEFLSAVEARRTQSGLPRAGSFA